MKASPRIFHKTYFCKFRQWKKPLLNIDVCCGTHGPHELRNRHRLLQYGFVGALHRCQSGRSNETGTQAQ